MALERGVDGRVMVNFIVDEIGLLNDIKIVRSAEKILSKDLNEVTLQNAKTALDEEVIRMIKTMPRWKPGMQKGRLVKVSLSLPIVFEL